MDDRIKGIPTSEEVARSTIKHHVEEDGWHFINDKRSHNETGHTTINFLRDATPREFAMGRFLGLKMESPLMFDRYYPDGCPSLERVSFCHHLAENGYLDVLNKVFKISDVYAHDTEKREYLVELATFKKNENDIKMKKLERKQADIYQKGREQLELQARRNAPKPGLVRRILNMMFGNSKCTPNS